MRHGALSPGRKRCWKTKERRDHSSHSDDPLGHLAIRDRLVPSKRNAVARRVSPIVLPSDRKLPRQHSEAHPNGFPTGAPDRQGIAGRSRTDSDNRSWMTRTSKAEQAPRAHLRRAQQGGVERQTRTEGEGNDVSTRRRVELAPNGFYDQQNGRRRAISVIGQDMAGNGELLGTKVKLIANSIEDARTTRVNRPRVHLLHSH